ncbi:stage V sporulation protein AC [Tumebacillus amylolyticus]|uniref:stage V sporulation protein AC n=1 Tax=Tumebacillus amylolyticus TaxID=2801339 RepID=UPI003221C6AE
MSVKVKRGLQVKADYQKRAKELTPKRPVIANSIRAFLVGGLICEIGQFIQQFFIAYFGFNEKNAGNPTVAVLIFISTLLTGIGVYDRIGQWAGAGSAVPVTGFANSMASAAIEHRSEGTVLGIGGQMFKLAGPVIVFGTVAAFIIGLVKTLFQMAAS